MPIFYRKVQDQSSNEAKNGKYYGRLINSGTMNTNDICEHIAEHGTIYTPDVVKGVLEKFVQCFKHLLLDGHKLKLDGLGTFYISASTIGAESAEKFTAANIKSARVRFLGDQVKNSKYTTRSISDGATFIYIGDVASPKNNAPANTDNGGGTDEPIENRP